MITYSTQETAEILGINRHHLPLMRELGMLLGIKTGRSVRYSDTELEEFWNTYKGADLSNEEMIRMTAVLHRTKK